MPEIPWLKRFDEEKPDEDSDTMEKVDYELRDWSAKGKLENAQIKMPQARRAHGTEKAYNDQPIGLLQNYPYL